MANRIQLRRGGAQDWANSNPTLAQGELGIELDTGRFKIGDGVTAWNTLRYERPVESTSNTANTLVQRDADGNFSAGTITSTIIGNASTSSRLASARQLTLSDDIVGSGVFDGSANLTISTGLQLISTLPHYDGTASASATYTKVTVDAKGRITNASNPTTLADYNLNGTVEGSSAQPYDLDLVAIAGLTTTGMISRTSGGAMATRTITGTATRIGMANGNGVSGNPTIDLITTAVVAGDYNTESLTSVSGVGSNSEPFGTETVNATKFTVDAYGRLTSSTNVPIATATQGTLTAAYNAGTTYSRGDKITNASKLYQAIAGISAGAGAPTHSDTSDAGSWRHLGATATPQKGLASFDQEDFDVDAAGHVTMSLAGIDNGQLQNSRISFADGNAVEHFDLDQELTTTTGYRGLNKLNYIKINDTSGNLLFGANNTGDSSAGEIDVNVRSYFSDPDITLDGAVAQTLDKTGDGNLTFQTTQNSTSARTLSILATNSGSGNSGVVVTAENTVTITASDAAGKVQVEDTYFQGDYIASSAATMILDPGDDRAVSGKVQIMGDLQVDGTTTTINSSITTLDDPIITLGGDTAPVSDDNKDRGVEFRYYDASAKVGFFGYDDSASDPGGHTGAFTFLYDATNTSEVFSGTDAGIVAGNLKLTTNTNSTSNTTGDLVVAGGAGIGDDVNIGGLLDVDGTFRANSTSRFDDNIVFQGASKTLSLNNGSGTTKIQMHTTTGNAEIGGILTNTGAIDANSTLDVAGLVHFESTDAPTISLNSGTDLYQIDSSDYGALQVDGGGYIDKDILFNGNIYLNGDFNQRDSSSESWGFRNWLQVRYKGRFGSSAAYTPSYATHNTSNLRVYGGAGIATTLHIGGTAASQGLFVGKKDSGDTVKFSVLGATGNTTIVGTLNVNDAVDLDSTLNVDAAATFQDNVTINADNKMFTIENNSSVDQFTVDTDNGNTYIGGTITVDDAAELNSTLNVDLGATFQDNVTINADNKFFKVQNNSAVDKFTVDTDNGNTTIAGTLDVTSNVGIDGDFDIATSKFTVASATGNTVIDGTLTVDEQVTITSGVTINDANKEFLIQNGSAVSKFTVDTDNGNTNIIGTLTVGDATQINDTFGVSGVVTATNNTEQTLTGTYAADGSARFSGGIGLAKNLAVGGGIRVYGGTELSGALDLNSSADISGALVCNDNVNIKADNKMFTIETAGGVDKFTVDTDNGNTDIRGTLDVGGDFTAESNFTVTGNFTVNGTTTTVNSTVTTYDDPIITLGGDTAPVSNDGKDKGVEFRYYDGSAKIGFFGYDRSTSEFALLTSATNTSEVLSGTDGALRIGSVHVTGAGTSLDVDNNLNVDGTATIDGQITSNLADGTAPFVITSTTKVNNLNVDRLDNMTTASANTASTVVNRDSSGDFAANQITAASAVGAGAGFLGNATTADAWKTARTFTIDGVVSGSVSVDGSAAPTITTTYVDADITALAAQSGTGYMVRTAANTYAHRTFSVTASSGITLTNADGISGNTTINVASASSNASNNLVLRDGSGDFAANVITASLTGDVTGNLVAATSTAKDLNPAADSTYDLGTTAVRWQGIFADAANITAITGDLTGNIVGTTSTAKNLNPAADSTYDLGTNTVRWQNIYADSATISTVNAELTGNVTGNVTGNLIGATSTAKNLNPATDSTHDLGATGTRWANVFADAANITAITGTLTGTVSSIANHDTGALTEGSNLYYTDERVDDRLNAVIIAGTGVTKAYDDAANTYTLSVTQADVNTDTVTEGSTNLFTTAARTRTHFTYGTGIKLATADLAIDFTEFNTGSITEGSNLYYTDERVDDRVNALLVASTGITKVYDDTAGTYTLSVTQADISTDTVTEGSTNLFTTAARTRTHFTYGTGITHSSGTLSVTQADIDTDNVTEGSTNLFTTAARTRGHFTYGTGITHDGSGALSVTQADINTDNITEGSSKLFFTNTRADARVAAATGANLDLSQKSTTNLPEGTNLYHTEARVQAKLDNAFDQLKAMLNNLATTTTLKVNLSGDPTPGTVVTLGSISNGGLGGYTAGSNVATTGGTGSSLTVDTTVTSGAITGIALNTAGTGYLIGDTITITNPNLGGVKTLNLGSLSNGVGGFSSASAVATSSSGSGTSCTVDTTADGNGALTNVVINAAGSGYAIGETLTITNPNAGGVATVDTLVGGTGYANGSAIATTGGGGSALSLDLTTSNGVVTGVVINAAGTGYAVDETITIVNANATGAKTLGSIATAGTGYAGGTGIATAASGSGSAATVDITVDGSGAVTGVTINDDGLNYAASEVLTITNANASGVKTLAGSGGGTGYTAANGVATTSSGSGTGLTVDVTVSNGVVTGVTINDDGLNYAASEVITITNANASGVNTLGSITAAGTGYTSGTVTGVATTSSGSGTGLTVDVTADGSGNVTGVAINNDGLNYAASEIITISGEGNGDATITVSAIHGNGAQVSVSAIHGNGCTIPVSAIHGNGATVDVATIFANATVNTSTVFTNATFALSDITAMEVGATLTGSTSGTTGVITAMDATSVTVDNVDGFFKSGETVGANDVTNLTISSFG